MRGATHLHLLALELASEGVSDDVATDKLVAEASGHDEDLLGALIDANQILEAKRATDNDRRAAMLLRLALLACQQLPGRDGVTRARTRLGVAWTSAEEPLSFAHDLTVDLDRLQAAASEEPEPPRRRHLLTG